MALIYAATEVSGGNIIDVINGLNGAGTADGTAFTTASTLNLGNPSQLQSVALLSILMSIKTAASSSGSIFLEKVGRFIVRFESNSSKTITFIMDGVGGDGLVTSPSSSFALDTYFDLVLRWDGTTVDNQIFIDINGVSTQGTVSGSADFSGSDNGDFIINNSAGDVTFEYLYIYDEFLSYADGEAIRTDPDGALPAAAAPTLDTPQPDVTIQEGQTGTIDLGSNFSDPNAGDTLTFSISPDISLVTGFSFNTSTGVISYDGNQAAATAIAYTVTASDGTLTADDTFNLTVTVPALSIDSISDATPEYDTAVDIMFSNAADVVTAGDFTVNSQGAGTANIQIFDPVTKVLAGETYPTVNFQTPVNIPLNDGTTTANQSIQIQIKSGEMYGTITEVNINGIYANDVGAAIGQNVTVRNIVGDWFIDIGTGLVSVGEAGGSFDYAIYNGEWSEIRTVSTEAGDVTAPVLSLPTATGSGSTFAAGTVTTDEGNGTLYYYASENASETAATIKSSGSTQSVSATGVQSVNFYGLTPETAYYMHYVQDDEAENESNVASSSQFTTNEAGSIPAFSRKDVWHIGRYLQSTGSYNSKGINEIVMEWLISEGIGRSQLNYMLYLYLEGLGYTGTLNDKLRKWSLDS